VHCIFLLSRAVSISFFYGSLLLYVLFIFLSLDISLFYRSPLYSLLTHAGSITFFYSSFLYLYFHLLPLHFPIGQLYISTVYYRSIKYLDFLLLSLQPHSFGLFVLSLALSTTAKYIFYVFQVFLYVL
jgi:hypothetical protein